MPVPTPAKTLTAASPEPGLLDAFANEFIHHLEQQNRFAPNTRQAYASDLRRFIDSLAGQLGQHPTLEDFQPDILQAYFEQEAEIGQSRSTLARRKVTLKKFHHYLWQAGHIPADFSSQALDAIELPEHLTQANPPGIQLLSSADVNQVLKQMENARRPRVLRDQALFMLVAGLGLPVNRLVSLDLADVDLPAGTLRPRADDATWVQLGHAAEYLARYLSQGRPDLNPNSDDPALFISQLGGRLSRQGVWQILEHWGKASSFNGQVSPRALRYTAAAQMLQAGRPLEEIHLLLGHSNLLSTQAFLRRLSRALSQDTAAEYLFPIQASELSSAEPR